MTPLVQSFMTHRMADADIEALSTGRQMETAEVMDAVRRSLDATPGPLQHVVVYGPRGFGKSFMARVVQIEAEKLSRERKPVRFVMLPEEQHNITRNPHALLDYIAQKLADLRTGVDSSWHDSMFQWPDARRDDELWERSTVELEAELDQASGHDGALAIVVIENFDTLLATLFKSDAAEQRLRKWLERRNNRVMLIATATGTVDLDYERPLFQAFQSINLDPWSPDECIRYFNRRRERDGNPPLDPGMEAKARAIADFIGGNPRLAQLLTEVLETQDALSVAQTMNALADRLADYYRQRIDDLPPLAQGVLDALIRGGEPASQTDLAKRVGATGQNTVARVMQDLQRADVIRGLTTTDSRATLYSVTDRVFVHFYRLRQGNQAARTSPLSTIVDFLRSFYSRDEQMAQAIDQLNAGRPAEARIFAGLAAKNAPSPAAKAAADGVQAIALRRIADSFGDLGQHGEAITTGREAAALAEKAGDLSGQAIALRYVTWSLGQSGQHEDAITTGRETASLAEKAEDVREQAIALRFVTWSLGRLGQLEDAITTGREAASLAEKVGDIGEQAEALRLIAVSLRQSGNHEDAITAAADAFERALSISDGFDIRGAVITALHAAHHIAEPRVIGLFEQWVDWSTRQDNSEFTDWVDWLSYLFAAATRARAWVKLDSVLSDNPGRLDNKQSIGYVGFVGSAIAFTANAEGRAAGFEAASGILPRIRGFLGSLPEQLENADWLYDIVTAFAEECRDPGLLRDVAGLLTDEFAPDGPAQAALLEALATVDEAEKPEAVLARMDPDIAVWIRRIRDLPEPAPKRRKRKRRAG